MGVEDYLDGCRRNNQNSRRLDEPGNEQGNYRKKVNKGGQASDSRPTTSQKPRLVNNFSDYSQFTPLNAPVYRIYTVACDQFTTPAPMKGDPVSR